MKPVSGSFNKIVQAAGWSSVPSATNTMRRAGIAMPTPPDGWNPGGHGMLC